MQKAVRVNAPPDPIGHRHSCRRYFNACAARRALLASRLQGVRWLLLRPSRRLLNVRTRVRSPGRKCALCEVSSYTHMCVYGVDVRPELADALVYRELAVTWPRRGVRSTSAIGYSARLRYVVVGMLDCSTR